MKYNPWSICIVCSEYILHRIVTNEGSTYVYNKSISVESFSHISIYFCSSLCWVQTMHRCFCYWRMLLSVRIEIVASCKMTFLILSFYFGNIIFYYKVVHSWLQKCGAHIPFLTLRWLKRLHSIYFCQLYSARLFCKDRWPKVLLHDCIVDAAIWRCAKHFQYNI